MKVILLLCLLSIVAGQQYFSLLGSDGRAISLGNGGKHGYLKVAPYDPLDTHQHWTFQTVAGYDGLFVSSRPFPHLVFDVVGEVTGIPYPRLAAWTRKSGYDATLNQRFFSDGFGFFSPVLADYLYVSYPVWHDTENTVKLNGRTQSSLGLTQTAAPPLHTIKVMGNSEQITIQFTNSRREPNWIIPANTPFIDKRILAGTILRATNSAGIELAPCPFTVSGNATITFSVPSQ